MRKDQPQKEPDSSEGSEGSNESLLGNVSKGRGRPAGSLTAVNYWTRIISLSYGAVDMEAQFSIDDDMV